jgi:hypothetical protein
LFDLFVDKKLPALFNIVGVSFRVQLASRESTKMEIRRMGVIQKKAPGHPGAL